MSKRKNTNPSSGSNPYVTTAFCDERFSRVMDGIKGINEKLDELKTERKETSHFWRNFLAGIVSGVALMLIGYGFSLLPGL